MTNLYNLIASLNDPLKKFDDCLISSVSKATSEKDIVANNGICKVLRNAAPSGYEQAITTLTKIKSELIKQKFYTVNLADYIPIQTGDGAFTEESLYYTNFRLADNFSSGVIGHQGSKTRKAAGSPAYDKKTLPNYFWAKEIDYSLIEVRQANQNMGGAINLIQQKEEVIKESWDLGIQEVFGVGMSELVDVDGITTLSSQGVNSDVTVIPVALKNMTFSQLQTVAQNLISAYRSNSNNTAMPDCFVIPELDFIGLGSAVVENQPLQNKFEFLQKAFVVATGNRDFQVKPLQYCDKNNNDTGFNRYILYKKDKRTLEMNIPIEYTSTTFATANGFDFANVAYGQFSGIIAKRPLEIMYFDNTVTLT